MTTTWRRRFVGCDKPKIELIICCFIDADLIASALRLTSTYIEDEGRAKSIWARRRTVLLEPIYQRGDATIACPET